MHEEHKHHHTRCPPHVEPLLDLQLMSRFSLMSRDLWSCTLRGMKYFHFPLLYISQVVLVPGGLDTRGTYPNPTHSLELSWTSLDQMSCNQLTDQVCKIKYYYSNPWVWEGLSYSNTIATADYYRIASTSETKTLNSHIWFHTFSQESGDLLILIFAKLMCL